MWIPVLQSTFAKVSGFNNVLLPICKGFKCVSKFVTPLIQINREIKQNWTNWKLFLHYRCLKANLMELIVNPIFCDKSFLVTKTWKFFRHVGVPMWDTKMATLLSILRKANTRSPITLERKYFCASKFGPAM